MDQVLPHSLWIGSLGDLQDFRTLHDVGIKVVVQVAYEELLPPLPREMVQCRFPILDGEGNDPRLLHLSVQTLARLVEAGFATLICCQAGTSRSPALAAAALAVTTRESLAIWLNRIANCRAVSVHPALLRELEAACFE